MLAGLAALVALATAPGPAEAQRSWSAPVSWEAELFGGAASPKGDLGDVNDDGLLGGLALSYRIHPQLAIRLEGVFENLERGGRPALLGGVRGPKTDLWHYTIGVEALFTRPVRTDWRLGLQLGAGGTYVDAGPALVPEGVEDEPDPEIADGFTGHELTARGALIGGYRVADDFTLFARGGLFVLFGDAQDPEGSFLGKEAIFTHEAGVRIGL